MIEKFREKMSNSGFDYQGDIVPDGRLHRIRINGDKPGALNGWYVLHPDEPMSGAFGNWKLGISKTWTSKDAETMTPADKAKLEARMQETRRLRDAEKAKVQGECRKQSSETLKRAQSADTNHPYLTKKGVKPYGIKQDGEELLIPVGDAAGNLHGMQRIKPDGTKRFKVGTVVTGHYFSVGTVKENTIILAEGYADGASLHECTGHAVAVAFNAGNLEPVAKALLQKFPDIRLIVCGDNDESGVGQQAAESAAMAGKGSFVIPPTPGTDFNDLHQKDGAGAVRSCIESAIVADKTQRCGCVADTENREGPEIKGCGVVADKTTLPGESMLEDAVSTLATLSKLEYDQARKEAAEKLGVRATVLDQVVKEARNSCGIDTDLPFEKVVPWPEQINPAEILSEVAEVVRRFIVCNREVSNAVALWVSMTWFMDVVQVAPLAVITAPEKRCGKTILLGILARLTARAITASSISPAALFRAVDAWNPTLLIDEVDACMRDNEELRGIINSGHTRDSAYVIRTAGYPAGVRRRIPFSSGTMAWPRCR